MFWNQDKLFCEINPTCYAISKEKEVIKRRIKNQRSKDKLASMISDKKLPNIVSEYESILIKKGKGIDPILQENKAINIKLACEKMNRLIICPGEVFSFWQLVGKTTKRKGYKEGHIMIGEKILPGLGGDFVILVIQSIA